MEVHVSWDDTFMVTPDNEAALNQQCGGNRYSAIVHAHEWYPQSDDSSQDYEDGQDLHDFMARTHFDTSNIVIQGVVWAFRARQQLPPDVAVPALLLTNAALLIDNEPTFAPTFRRWPLLRHAGLVAIRLDSITDQYIALTRNKI